MAEENLDVLDLLITATDEVSPELKGIAEEQQRTAKKLVADIEKQQASMDAAMVQLIEHERQFAMIAEAKQTARGAELEALEYQQKEIERNQVETRKQLQQTEKELMKNKEAYNDMFDSVKNGSTEYGAHLEKIHKKEISSMHEVRRALRHVSQGYRGVKPLLMGLGSASKKAGGELKTSFSANINSLNEMRESAGGVQSALVGMAGIDFSGTIQGLSGVAEQLELMKKMQKSGQSIGALMKMNLALTAVQALGPAIKATIDYFKNAADAARQVGIAVDGMNKTHSQRVEIAKETLEKTKLYIKLSKDEATAEANRKEGRERISRQYRAMSGELERLDKRYKTLWSWRNKEEMELNQKEQAIIKDKLAQMDKMIGALGEQNEAEKQLQELRRAGAIHDEQEARKAQIELLQKELDLKKQGASADEIEIMKAYEQAKAEGKRGDELKFVVNQLKEEQRIRKELAKLDQQEPEAKDANEGDGGEEFKRLKESFEEHRKMMLDRNKFMTDYEESLKKQYMTQQELRKEELERLGISKDMQHTILSNEEEMQALKDKGVDPQEEMQADKVSRFSSGKSTDQMTEMDRKTLKHQAEMEDLAKKQLQRFKDVFPKYVINGA